MKWTHRQLVDDLTIAKDTPYIEVAMGSKWITRPPPPIADVVVIRPSYTRFCMDIYEVKVSHSDFLSDIKSNKWRSYLPFCHRFYFATPSNLIDRKEIPPDAGWIVRGDHGWKTIIHAPAKNVIVDYAALYSLIFHRQRKGRKESYLWWHWWQKEANLIKKLGKKIGIFIAPYLRQLDELCADCKDRDTKCNMSFDLYNHNKYIKCLGYKKDGVKP